MMCLTLSLRTLLLYFLSWWPGFLLIRPWVWLALSASWHMKKSMGYDLHWWLRIRGCSFSLSSTQQLMVLLKCKCVHIWTYRLCFCFSKNILSHLVKVFLNVLFLFFFIAKFSRDLSVPMVFSSSPLIFFFFNQFHQPLTRTHSARTAFKSLPINLCVVNLTVKSQSSTYLT